MATTNPDKGVMQFEISLSSKKVDPKIDQDDGNGDGDHLSFTTSDCFNTFTKKEDIYDKEPLKEDTSLSPGNEASSSQQAFASSLGIEPSFTTHNNDNENDDHLSFTTSGCLLPMAKEHAICDKDRVEELVSSSPLKEDSTPQQVIVNSPGLESFIVTQGNDNENGKKYENGNKDDTFFATSDFSSANSTDDFACDKGCNDEGISVSPNKEYSNPRRAKFSSRGLKSPLATYETFVWVLFVSTTILAIVDRFTTNFWPRQMFSIGSGSAGNDRLGKAYQALI
eukprot:CAMPEP_0201131298 /NCGR_PEP_ID=MMETSP0850-20130426/42431_1 /ASSEMBLY_ACC=CAM_ASM_000622 /TAXON_ID=183588 /ORGANISM="Pseudo-nitzschia fraudulenta, Strain WWA7" /LENGTH=281 /DNA_ID=CAMNT_0047401305 /DNA_START=242 /DNA_END=1087 /DNA_ORIENTATION=+